MAEGQTVVSEVRVPHTEQGVYYVISVLNVDTTDSRADEAGSRPPGSLAP
jgi:hypothetical protein